MDQAAICADIWAQECAIYAGRAAGTFDAYRAALAPGYLAWPPHQPAPTGAAGLADRPSQEILDMQLTAFTLNGATAIIYYQTHRRMRPDGTPVDERFDVIHVWVTQDGAWKILGGMARATPAR